MQSISLEIPLRGKWTISLLRQSASFGSGKSRKIEKNSTLPEGSEPDSTTRETAMNRFDSQNRQDCNVGDIPGFPSEKRIFPGKRGKTAGLSGSGIDFEFLIEDDVEIVDILEVFDPISGCFSHASDADQIEDDLPDVVGRSDSPTVQHRFGHVTVLFQREKPHRFTEFLSRDVRFRLIVVLISLFERLAGAILSHLEGVVGVIEGIEHETVGIKFVTGILFEQFGDLLMRVLEHSGSISGFQTAGET
jgi:hypothetical protein